MIKRCLASIRRAYHRHKMRRARGYTPASYQRYIYHKKRSEE